MIAMNKEITGIVLAGGLSSRMGEDKSLLDFKGKKLIEQVVEAIRPYVDNIMIVADNHEKFSFLPNVTMVRDFEPGRGPLVGMISGLELISTSWAFVTSCDLPFLKGEVVDYLWMQKDGSAVVPWSKGYYEPLAGLYHRDAAIKAKEFFLQGGKSLNGFLKSLESENLVTKIDKEDILKSLGVDIFINVNDKKTYDDILER